MTYLSNLDRLLELDRTRSVIGAQERRQRELVAALRANEEPWQSIGAQLGISRQAAQQKFQTAIEPLMKTDQYHCDCGWSIAYPMFEWREANEDIADHEEAHYRESTKYDPG